MLKDETAEWLFVEEMERRPVLLAGLVDAQLPSATWQPAAMGMGMGLAICRSIVEAHHGEISVDRDPVLGGARFTVELPLAAQYRPETDTP